MNVNLFFNCILKENRIQLSLNKISLNKLRLTKDLYFFTHLPHDTRLHVFKIKFQAILKTGLSSSEKDDFICFNESSLK